LAVTSFYYGSFFTKLANKEIDLDTDVIKIMLTTSAYTPLQDTHDYKDDVTNEITGTGYTATGATLGTKTSVYTGGTNTWAFDAADAVWTTSTFTARYAVIYDSTPATDATRPLICYIDFGADVSVSAGTFTVTFAAGGICNVVVS
jgi:hypothetical protein